MSGIVRLPFPPERPAIDQALQPWLAGSAARLAPGHVDTRLEREARKARQAQAAEHERFNVRSLARSGLALGGLGALGRRNARDLRAMRRHLALPALPAEFEGLRLLHVSDPHFGADAGIDAAIVACVSSIEHDLCVMTGDYRHQSFDAVDTALERLERLRAVLPGEVLAVLGNHDSILMVPAMEAMGIDVLLNEHRTLRRGEAALHVAGVDDPRYYRLDDLGRALDGRETDGVSASATLLLAHSPEIAPAAAAAGCDAYLCGHTHGGQICLPGGVPVVRNVHAPRERFVGPWQLDGMRGYTSRGAGVSVAEARFFCPPEITLHVLGRAAQTTRLRSSPATKPSMLSIS